MPYRQRLHGWLMKLQFANLCEKFAILSKVFGGSTSSLRLLLRAGRACAVHPLPLHSFLVALDGKRNAESPVYSVTPIVARNGAARMCAQEACCPPANERCVSRIQGSPERTDQNTLSIGHPRKRYPRAVCG